MLLFLAGLVVSPRVAGRIHQAGAESKTKGGGS